MIHYYENKDVHANIKFNIEDLDLIIRRSSSNKAAGLDQVTNEMIKSAGKELRALMIKLFECCLRNGCFPWKQSVIVPIHKRVPSETRTTTDRYPLAALLAVSSLNYR